jgi:hypothetical protein
MIYHDNINVVLFNNVFDEFILKDQNIQSNCQQLLIKCRERNYFPFFLVDAPLTIFNYANESEQY